MLIVWQIDYGFSHVDSGAAWRTPIGIQLIFAIIVVFIVWGLPESPRWLAKRGREKEAVEVLCAVFDLQEDDEYVQGEMEAIRAAIAIVCYPHGSRAPPFGRETFLRSNGFVEF